MSTANKPPAEPVVLMLAPGRAAEFGANLRRLQEAYGTDSVVDTVERALDAACDRL